MTELKEIIEGCRSNDRTAQKAFYDRFARIIYPIAKRYGKVPEDCHDIFNRSFLKIFDNLGNLKDPEAIEGWMRRITVNTAIDFYRNSKSYRDRFGSLEEVQSSGETEAEGTADGIINKMELEQAMKELKNERPAGFLVFNLFVIEGYSHAEIAQRIGIRVDSSRYHLSSARKFLRSKLQTTSIS